MRRNRLSVLVLATLGALLIPASARAASELETIALTLLAQKFGIGQQQALDLQGLTNRSVFDMAPVYSTSYYTHRSVNDVWNLRRQGLGWGQIAQRLGMNPGTFNKLRKSGAFDRDAIWGSIYRDRYGVRDSDLVAIRRRGGSIEDALPACIIARAARQSPEAVYTRYRTDRDWHRTARTYKVDLRNPARYATPGGGEVRAHRKQGGNGPRMGPSSGQGKGRGNQIAPEAGRGIGKGDREGRGQGGGNGRGHGGGKGRGNGGR